MAVDSTLIAAFLLLGIAAYASRPGTGNYLRFAAILCAALAAALLSRVNGLAAAAAFVTLPLTGAALGLSALARARRRISALVASMALAASLAAGLFAFFTAMAGAALLPLALGGVAMMASGRVFAMLSGLLLLAAACAGWSAGLSSALLTLLAASLFGAGLYRRVSNRTALAPVSP